MKQKNYSKTMETGNQIYSSLAAISRDIKCVGKNQRNEGQRFNFRGIDQVMNELHNSFAKHGVCVLPKVEQYEVKEASTKSGAIQYHTIATVTYTYIAEDGSSVQTTNVGEAMDMADKGMNKAMSAALKYSLLQLFLIPTEEKKDEDYFTPEETYHMGIQNAECRMQNEVQVEVKKSANPIDYNPYAQKVQELRAIGSRAQFNAWQAKNKDLLGVPEIKNLCIEVAQKFPRA